MMNSHESLDSEIRLQPLDPDTELARRRIREPQRELLPAEFSDEGRGNDSSAAPIQYGIREMLIATSVLAVGLATLQFVAPTWIAFIIGLLAMASFIGVSIFQPDVPALHRACWCLLLTYILVAIIALCRP